MSRAEKKKYKGSFLLRTELLRPQLVACWIAEVIKAVWVWNWQLSEVREIVGILRLSNKGQGVQSSALQRSGYHLFFPLALVDLLPASTFETPGAVFFSTPHWLC